MFKKGQSGNPGGRPKSKILSEAYRKLLETEIAKGKDKGKTYAEVIAAKILKEARKGVVKAASEIANRVEGKPLQSVQISASDPLEDLLAAFDKESDQVGSVESET